MDGSILSGKVLKRGGRPRKLTAEKMDLLRKLAPDYCVVEIARALQIRQATVTYLCHKYGIVLGKINPNDDRLLARVKRSVTKVYIEEAGKRNISVDSLVYRVLSTVAKDGLFDAILDHVEEPQCDQTSKTSLTESN